MKGIIFDCDGVLLDTRQANEIYYNALRAHVGLPPLSKEEEEFAFSATVQESLERHTPQEKLAEIVKASEKMPYLDTVLVYITLDEELPLLLQRLSEDNKKIGIFTNRTHHGVIEVLEHFGIHQYFTEIMTCDDVPPKPSAEGLLRIERAWGIPLHELVFVGDTMADYGAAKQTSVNFVAFRNHHVPAEVHVHSFNELAPIMGVL